MEEFKITPENLDKLINFIDGIAQQFFVLGSADILRHILDRDFPDNTELRAYMEKILTDIRKQMAHEEPKTSNIETA